MNNRELLTKLIKKYSLHPDDAFIDQIKGYKIIRRRGYMKIQNHIGAVVELDLMGAGADWAIVKARGMTKDYRRETLGEASPLNNAFPYPVAVAQKRAEGRITLELAKLYEEGWLTEDEIDQQVQADKIAAKRDEQGKQSIDETKKALGL